MLRNSVLAISGTVPADNLRADRVVLAIVAVRDLT